jgi:PadR family transcriptional regulator PadR
MSRRNPILYNPYTLVFYVYWLTLKKLHYLLNINMIPKNLTAASTKLIILGILRQGSSYGYLIIKKIKELSGGKMEYSDGMLYPVLHNLEKNGLIQSRWVMEGDTRPRKYYEITENGKKELIREREHWSSVNSVLDAIWEFKPTK